MSRALLAAACLAAIATSADADECVTVGVRPRVRELLGRDVFDTMTIAIETRGTTASVTVGDAGTRTMTAHDCSELVDWIVLVIVMSARAESPPEPPGPSRGTESLLKPTPASDAEQPPAPRVPPP